MRRLGKQTQGRACCTNLLVCSLIQYALQAELLDAAAQLVKPGGVLVYSTCSIETDEGEEQVAAFLAREAGSGFKLEPLKGVLPDAVLTPSGCLATLPHVHGGVDGAFAARLRRVA